MDKQTLMRIAVDGFLTTRKGLTGSDHFFIQKVTPNRRKLSLFWLFDANIYIISTTIVIITSVCLSMSLSTGQIFKQQYLVYDYNTMYHNIQYLPLLKLQILWWSINVSIYFITVHNDVIISMCNDLNDTSEMLKSKSMMKT